MRRAWLIGTTLLAIGGASYLCFSPQARAERLVGYAFHRPDNDFLPWSSPEKEKDAEAIPLPYRIRFLLARRLVQVARENAYITDGDDIKKTSDPKVCFKGLNLIRGPNGLNWLFLKTGWTFNSTVDAFVWNPVENTLSPKPAEFDLHWMERPDDLIRLPVVSFDDLDLDGRPEMVFQRREHNGTTLNAAQYLYLRVGPDMSLSPMLTLQTRLVDILSENEEGWILRRIEKIDPASLRIHTSGLPKEGQPEIPLGWIHLQRPNPGGGFTVVTERHPLVETYRSFPATNWLEPRLE